MDRPEGPAPRAPHPVEVALLASVFVIAACGLVYELAAGALASYLLGDSVLQFSTVIGAYLFAMGVGSYLSRFFERQLPILHDSSLLNCHQESSLIRRVFV